MDGMPPGVQGLRPPRSPQTEPVDFSAPPRPLTFSLGGPIGPAPYSRESTPDSAASHYMDSYRDPSGMHYLLRFQKTFFLLLNNIKCIKFKVIALILVTEW